LFLYPTATVPNSKEGLRLTGLFAKQRRKTLSGGAQYEQIHQMNLSETERHFFGKKWLPKKCLSVSDLTQGPFRQRNIAFLLFFVI
jgi:hypothetical protein